MIKEQIFNINSEEAFEKIAIEVFQFQAENCNVYKQFIEYLGVNPKTVNKTVDIPYLPIEFFKSHQITSSNASIAQTFSSSGTGGIQSKHYVTDLAIYENSYLDCFKGFYGDIEEYTVLALLPSYLEREGSSLIYMVNDLILKSKNDQSGFFLDDISNLINTLVSSEKKGKKTLLLGVSYALLDLVESNFFSLKNTIVMETGGMKGRRKEMIRKELHARLCEGFGVNAIHSEYGMTELLSQAYSQGRGIFSCPNWMKIKIRDTQDPLALLGNNKTGGINVIDLANVNSCSFIATQDLGKTYNNGTFEVIGRFDNSDIRGCNLLIN